MIVVELSTSGLDLSKLDLKPTLQDTVEEAADFAHPEIQQTAPFHTGKYMSTVRKQVGHLEAEVGPLVPYAIFVEVGTRPHVITPKYARMLRFEAEGEVVFTPHVRHPCTKPQWVIRKAAEATAREVGRILADRVEEALK